MASKPLLELRLHLTNGNTHTFTQDDPEQAHELLHHVSLNVFTQPTVIVYGRERVAAYPGNKITGITIRIDPIPDYLLQLNPNATHIREITEADYRAKLRDAPKCVQAQPFLMLNEVEMCCGHRFWLEVDIVTAVGSAQERKILYNAFSWPSAVCQNLDGSVTIWNRAQMVSCSFAPKPDVPMGAWPAELVE
ncbi:hypothetical protein CCAX7_26890 [Capsulimonas corticalis]|uniref:Uncharacterized protein n=1 Tax=Capsulimonas corticalis TaxID=2219043 RepID=A0A402CTR2_9BACT|nr:hypothetical protein [Capsulimonas corticalis]BDI30638.1 hypothetical protein CCAX7_26890 [Capsulimonas corticalis]